MKYTKFILLLIAISASFRLYGQISQSEIEGLVDIYKSTDGANWDAAYRWDINKIKSGNVADEFGITLNEKGNAVIALDLHNIELSGTLPQDMFRKLGNLAIINVSSNSLSGNIPSSLSEATGLIGIDFSGNRFSGKIPNIDKLTNLRVIGLSFLSKIEKGQQLPKIGNFKSLEYLDIFGCGFVGSLPENIGELKELKSLELSENRITGHLPESLGQCTQLKRISAMNNRIGGELPNLERLENLQILFLSDNYFCGQLPEWIAKLSGLIRVSISYNNFEGALPNDLSGMKSLETFFAEGNYFSGTLPKYLPEDIEEFDLSWNNLEGEIPTEWNKLASLNKLILSHNNLSGYVSGKLYKPKGKQKESNFGNITVYDNRFSFYDFRDWGEFAEMEDVKFRFSLQKSYAKYQKIEAKSGESVKMDATYPGEKIGDETYQWFDLTTGKKIEGETGPVLTIDNVTSDRAHRYICFVSTLKFGTNYQDLSCKTDFGGLRTDKTPEDREEDNLNTDRYYNDLPPTMKSGSFYLYVDGKGPEIVSAKQIEADEKPYIYPSRTEQGASWNISAADRVSEVRFFSFTGSLVSVVAVNGQIVENNLPKGRYIALIKLAEGHFETQIVEVF